MAIYDGYDDSYQDDEEQRRRREQEYRPSVWTNDYQPGPDYNGGVAPDPPAPRYDYNNGSPPDQALTPGHGWVWEGPQQQTWNMDLNQWNRGVWQERSGEGLGYQKPQTTPQQPQQPTFQPPAAPSARPAQAPSIAQPIASPAVTSQLTKILQDRLAALSQPFDVNADDTYKQTLSAYNLGSERDARKQRAVAAERAAAGGYGSSGALDTKIRGIAERQGQNKSMFAAQTAADRLKQRDDQLVVAIQLARQVGQDDIANQLEQQRLRLSEQLGMADLGLRRELGLGNLGLGYDRLGLDYTALANSANRDSILALLGGG